MHRGGKGQSNIIARLIKLKAHFNRVLIWNRNCDTPCWIAIDIVDCNKSLCEKPKLVINCLHFMVIPLPFIQFNELRGRIHHHVKKSFLMKCLGIIVGHILHWYYMNYNISYQKLPKTIKCCLNLLWRDESTWQHQQKQVLHMLALSFSNSNSSSSTPLCPWRLGPSSPSSIWLPAVHPHEVIQPFDVKLFGIASHE